MKNQSNFFAVFAAIGFVVSVVFAVVVVLKTTSVRRHVPNTEPAEVAAAVEPARAEAPPAPLRALPPPQTPVATPRPAASQETELGAVDPPPAEPEPQAESRPFELQRQFLNTIFERQRRDPSWSRDAESELTQSLVPLVQNNASNLTRIECRRDLCRFEVRNRDEAAYDAAFNTTMRQRVWNGGMLLARSPTEPTTLVVYITKKGKLIPPPPIAD